MKSHDRHLEQLLTEHNQSLSGKVWRGAQKQKQQALDTGYPELNEQLHAGGWPLASTTELGLSQPGIGELRLLLPALSQLSQHQHIICIAPPHLPFAPALIRQGIDVSKFIIVQSKHKQDILWASEQALLSGCCAAVLSWTDRANLSNRELRRLQLAAEKSRTWNVLLRHSDCLQQASTSALRLHLISNAYSQLDVNILKQPGGWAGQHCCLSLPPHYENWQRLTVDLLPQHNQAPSERQQYQKQHQKQYRQHSSVTLLTPVSAVRSVH